MRREPSTFESLIDEFEDAWRNGKPPSIRSFLQRADASISRRELLHELIFIDLEFRWQASKTHPDAAWVLERYTQEYGELGPLNDLPTDFIAEEYRARKRWGDSPAPDRFLKRFPGRDAEVIAAISRVDEELRREFDRDSQPQADVFESMNPPIVRPPAGEDLRLHFDDYVLEQMIGAGQMGRVYRASQRDAQLPVAIKFLRKSFCRNRSAVNRFLTEARIVSRFDHPGIIRVHGIGTTPGGGYFFAMDHVSGPDLSQVIQSGLPSIQDAVNWTIQACQAVDYSHRSGIVHCDLKPANLLLDDARNVRVTDFGLARSLRDTAGTDERIAGTAPFMAPEQVSGWWGSIGPHTDVYGLGAILYALLTGKPPHSGTLLTDTLARVVSGMQADSVETIRDDMPSELAAVVNKCLTKAHTERYGSASGLENALRKVTLKGVSEPT